MEWIKLLERARDLLSAGKPDEARALLEADLSFDQKQSAIRTALRSTVDGNTSCWVCDVYNDFVIYEVSNAKGESSGLCKRPYTMDAAGGVTLGDAVQVRRVMTYEPIDAGAAVEESTSIEPLSGEFIALVERAVQADGTVPIKIIRPGWGSSGYYPAEVLKRDGPRIFREKMKMYWNHPTPEEEKARPEGDLNNVAAVLQEDARWLDDGPKGPGLYTRATVKNGYAPAIEDLASHIGVSIRARGQGKKGQAEGRTGTIIERLVDAASVDFVTEPGAGGEILSLFEAARPGAPPSSTPQQGGQEMAGTSAVNDTAAATPGGQNGADAQDQGALVESYQLKVDGLRTKNEMLLGEIKEGKEREGALLVEKRDLEAELAMLKAQAFVREVCEAKAVPAPLQIDILETVPHILKVKNGRLDEEAFRPLVEKRIQDRMALWAKVTKSGSVRGMGGSGSDPDPAQIQASLIESFRNMGLSEAGAKAAAAGRAV